MSDLIFLNTYSALISGLLMVCLGFFVFLKNPREKTNFIFLCFGLAMACWLLSSYKMYSGSSDVEFIFWDRVVYSGVVFVPVLMYHFGLVFTNTEKKNRLNLYLGYFTSLIFLALSGNENFLDGLYKFDWGVHTKAGIFHHFFLVFYSIYIILFLWEIYKFLRKANIGLIEKKRAQYLFVSFIILNLGAYAFLPAYSIDLNPIVAYWLEFAAVVIISFTILKYNLFGVKVLLTEILVFAIGAILFLLPFLLPSGIFRVLTIAVFILFCVFAFYLIRVVHNESRRREEAEQVASRERELRREAEELAANLKHLNEAKNQFLLSTQHHLRSPLSVVQGYLSMIGEGSYGRLPVKAKEKIYVSLETTKKLIRLVNELLDVAHFQMNKGIVAKQPTDAVKLVAGVVSDLEKSAEEKNIFLRFQKPDSPVAPVSIDPNGFREAVYNIIDNAIKYTRKGGVSVSIEAAAGRLRLIVADTGIGMDASDKLNLFNRTFERGDKAKKINATGKGIGLYLAAQMIFGNGGTLQVESEGRGKGSRFTIELPLGADSALVDRNGFNL